MHFGTLVGGFLDHFGVMLRSEIAFEGLWELCSAWKSISPPERRPFWRVLESLWGGFWKYFGIFCRYRFHYEMLHDFKPIFDGFWYSVNKQNRAKSMEGIAKINFSCCSLSNVFENWFWTGFGCRLGAILRPNWPSEATSKASFIQYTNEEGSRWGRSQLTTPPPPKIFSFGPQCERETGRASQADDTPNGVGGWREA